MWTFIKALPALIPLIIELWGFLKPIFIESPEKFSASVNEWLKDLRASKDGTSDERKAAAIAGARKFADLLRRG